MARQRNLPQPGNHAPTARSRKGGESFHRPTGPNHRRYEALRGYLYEGLTVEVAAARAGYSPATLRSAVRDFGATITVRLDRRTYSPVLRQADIPQVAVPWWGGNTLRFECA